MNNMKKNIFSQKIQKLVTQDKQENSKILWQIVLGAKRLSWLLVFSILFIYSSLLKAQPFTEVTTSLPGLSNPSIDWGDYDNDGDLDLLLTGN